MVWGQISTINSNIHHHKLNSKVKKLFSWMHNQIVNPCATYQRHCLFSTFLRIGKVKSKEEVCSVNKGSPWDEKLLSTKLLEIPNP